MARMSRGGSVLGFSIATLVMAGLLVGGAYTLRQLTTQQTAVAQNETPQSQTKPDVAQSPSDKTDKTNTNTNIQKSNSSSQDPNTTTLPASSDMAQASQLPHTGPGSFLGAIIAVGLLSATVVAYARSRRPELSL